MRLKYNGYNKILCFLHSPSHWIRLCNTSFYVNGAPFVASTSALDISHIFMLFSDDYYTFIFIFQFNRQMHFVFLRRKAQTTIIVFFNCGTRNMDGNCASKRETVVQLNSNSFVLFIVNLKNRNTVLVFAPQTYDATDIEKKRKKFLNCHLLYSNFKTWN